MRLPPPITSRTNARVKALRAAFAGRAARPGELTALEGEHLLGEAARAGLPLDTLFVREGSEAAVRTILAALQARETVVLSRDVFDSAVDTVTPQGLAATFSIPEAAQAEVPEDGPVLLLENVQDPGNVGTLIRSAAAFGAGAVALVGATANPWSPKVLRASAGAAFGVPVLQLSWAEVVRMFRPARRLLAAVPGRVNATDVTQTRLARGVLMIGNEGRGLTSEALQVADELITIPCLIESFNAAVAGSLLLYEAFRQASTSLEAR